MIKQYRKKPVVVEAVQWTGENYDEIVEFTRSKAELYSGYLMIPTLEGDHFAPIGDYIIKGVAGEFYPCRPDIFEQTYEMEE